MPVGLEPPLAVNKKEVAMELEGHFRMLLHHLANWIAEEQANSVLISRPVARRNVTNIFLRPPDAKALEWDRIHVKRVVELGIARLHPVENQLFG